MRAAPMQIMFRAVCLWCVISVWATLGHAKPNIILVLLDDWGISTSSLATYGGIYITPVLDRLSKDGMRFTHMFSTPLCCPSRAQLLTGKYPFRTGVTTLSSGGKLKPHSTLTISQLLQAQGYTTIMAGKWAQLRYLDTMRDAGAWGWDTFMRWQPLGGKTGHQYWDPRYIEDGRPVQAGPTAYGPELLHAYVTRQIALSRDRPFFLYYPMMQVHTPLQQTPRPLPGTNNWYTDNVWYADFLLGRLVTFLHQQGILSNTLLLITGDNGYQDRVSGGLSSGLVHGRKIDGSKGSLREGGSRVPLFAYWPATILRGGVAEDLVDFSDLLPTIAEVAGAPIPGDVDGHSFAFRLRGQRGTPREWVYVQVGQQYYVRTRQWKLYNDGRLMDMRDAPYREHPAVNPGMKAHLLAILRGLHAD